jgi:hypothetical protein
MKTLFRWTALAGFLAGLGLLIAGPISSQDLFPEGPGRDTLFLVCVQCHPPTRITRVKLSADDWQFIVYDMISRGAPVYEEDIDDLTKYLIDNFAVETK